MSEICGIISYFSYGTYGGGNVSINVCGNMFNSGHRCQLLRPDNKVGGS